MNMMVMMTSFCFVHVMCVSMIHVLLKYHHILSSKHEHSIAADEDAMEGAHDGNSVKNPVSYLPVNQISLMKEGKKDAERREVAEAM